MSNSGECESCGRFGPLEKRTVSSTGDGLFCPACAYQFDDEQHDAWSAAYGDLDHALAESDRLLGEAREWVLRNTVFGDAMRERQSNLLARIDAAMGGE